MVGEDSRFLSDLPSSPTASVRELLRSGTFLGDSGDGGWVAE
jgi:hypothetical protein